MSAPLQYDQGTPLAEAFLRAWLLPIATGPGAVSSELWGRGRPQLYRAVRRISGPLTLDSDQPLMRVHTFGATYTEAATEAARTDSRMLVLAEYPGWSTELGSGARACCDWAEITEAARHESYSAESVVTRFVSEYRLGISLVAV